jgi:hypothetical protein
MKPFLHTLAATLLAATAWPTSIDAQQISLSELSKSKLKSATAEATTYRGSAAFKLVPKDPKAPGYAPGGPLAIVNDIRFRNGAIDVDVAGAPAKGADESARGFICVRQTPTLTTSCAAITPRNTPPNPIGRGIALEKRVLVYTSRGSTWKPENGLT